MAEWLSDAARRRLAGALAADSTDPNAPGPSALDSILFAAGGPLAKGAAQGAGAIGKSGWAALTGAGGLLLGSGSAGEANDGRPSQPDMVERLARELMQTGRNVANDVGQKLGAGDQFTPKSLDDFVRERRSKRETLEEALKRAESEARNSAEYTNAMNRGRRMSAESIVQRAKKSAEDTWGKSQATVGGEDARIKEDYGAYVEDLKTKRSDYYNKGWQERYPAAATALGAASYALPLMLARRGYNKTAAEGEAIMTKLPAARGAEKERLLRELDLWRQQGTWENAKVTGKAAAIPLEIRTGGNVWDSTFLPDDAGAKTRAKEHISAMFGQGPHGAAGIVEEVGPSLLTGLTMAAGGSLLANRPPYRKAESYAAPSPGGPPGNAPTNPAGGGGSPPVPAAPTAQAAAQVPVTHTAPVQTSNPGRSPSSPYGPEHSAIARQYIDELLASGQPLPPGREIAQVMADRITAGKAAPVNAGQLTRQSNLTKSAIDAGADPAKIIGQPGFLAIPGAMIGGSAMLPEDIRAAIVQELMQR